MCNFPKEEAKMVFKKEKKKFFWAHLPHHSFWFFGGFRTWRKWRKRIICYNATGTYYVSMYRVIEVLSNN